MFPYKALRLRHWSGMISQSGVSKSPPLHTNLVKLTEHLDLALTVVERRYVSVFSIHGSLGVVRVHDSRRFWRRL